MNLIYVDDEQAAIQKFKSIVTKLTDINQVDFFTNSLLALEFVNTHMVDIAFLDIEMPGLDGFALTRELHKVDPNIKIVFVTAYSNYALDAFGIDALGYLLKSYSTAQFQRQIEKARLIRPIPRKKVYMQTIPSFEILVDDEILPIKSAKAKELLALLVDRNGAGISAGEAIACLWEDRANDDATGSLYRMTYKRLRGILCDAGIEFLLAAGRTLRAVNPDMYDSDYKRLLAGDTQILKTFDGSYMNQYSWAEETAGRLCRLLDE